MEFFERPRYARHASANTPELVEAGRELPALHGASKIHVSPSRDGSIEMDVVPPPTPRVPIKPYVDPSAHKRIYGRRDPQATMPSAPYLHGRIN